MFTWLLLLKDASKKCLILFFETCDCYNKTLVFNLFFVVLVILCSLHLYRTDRCHTPLVHMHPSILWTTWILLAIMAVPLMSWKLQDYGTTFQTSMNISSPCLRFLPIMHGIVFPHAFLQLQTLSQYRKHHGSLNIQIFWVIMMVGAPYNFFNKIFFSWSNNLTLHASITVI